jgi:hypothetical protein
MMLSFQQFFFIGFLLITPLSMCAQNNAEAGLDNIFRTSDEPDEIATQPSRRTKQRTQTLPEGSVRVGCICMTGEVRPTTGIGSCSGHGGVRYWLVVNAEGDTLRYPTARQALNTENEPMPYIGPNPKSPYTTPPPTIIFMPPTANSLVENTENTPPQYKSPDSVIFLAQAAPLPAVATQDPSLMGIPHLFDSIIQLCMLLIACGTLVIIVRMFLNQGTPEATNSRKIFKHIRLTLIKILFKNNRFFK